VWSFVFARLDMMVEMTLGTVGTIIQKALSLLGRWYISKGVWFNGTGS